MLSMSILLNTVSVAYCLVYSHSVLFWWRVVNVEKKLMTIAASQLGKQITVAMITMNEEAAVAIVIANIKNIVPDAEIVIVDSSKDKTPLIAAEYGAKVIRQFPPQGYGPAM